MREITLLNEKHAQKLKPHSEDEDTFLIKPQSQPFQLPKIIMLKNDIGNLGKLTPEEQELRMKHLRFKFRLKQKVRHRRSIQALDLLDPVKMEANMQSMYTRVRSKRARAALNRLETEYVRCKKQTQDDCMSAFMRMYQMAKEITEKMDKMQEIIKGQLDSGSHESHDFEPYSAKKTRTTNGQLPEVTTPNTNGSAVANETTETTPKPVRVKIKPAKISWIIDGHGHDEQDAYAENTPRVVSTTDKPNITTMEHTTMISTTESGTTESGTTIKIGSSSSSTKMPPKSSSTSSWSALTTEEPDLDTIADNITWILDRFDKPKEIVPTTEGTIAKTVSTAAAEARKETTAVTAQETTTLTSKEITLTVTTDALSTATDLHETTHSTTTIDLHTDPHTQDNSKATTKLTTTATHFQDSSNAATEPSTVATETLITTLTPENDTMPRKLMHDWILDIEEPVEPGTTAVPLSLLSINTTTEVVDTSQTSKQKPLKYSWIIDGSDDSGESNSTTQATTRQLNTDSTTQATTRQINTEITTNQSTDTTYAVHPLDNPSSRENMLESSEEEQQKQPQSHKESTTVPTTTSEGDQLPQHHNESTTVEATASITNPTLHHNESTTAKATTSVYDRTHWLQQFEQQVSSDQDELIETFGTDMDAMSLQQMGSKLNPVSGQTLNGECN